MQHFINHKRAGFTLLEVLIATSVIMVGIFGIASAIALCEQLFKTSFRADMAANCGRAALETMLAEDFMKDNFTPSATLTNPVLKTCNWTAGTNSNLTLSDSQKTAADFECKDHLRQNNSLKTDEEDPPNYDTTLKSDYSWVGTIHQISGEYCEVSAAVAYKRYRNANGTFETLQNSGSIKDNFGVINAEVSELWKDSTGTSSDDMSEQIQAGHFVLLAKDNIAHWYRIENVYTIGGIMYLQLHGPGWKNAESGISGVTFYTPGGVVGVYTQIVPIQNR